MPNSHGVTRVGAVSDGGTNGNIRRRDGGKGQLDAGKDIGEEVDLELHVLLRSQTRDVTTHEHVEVNIWWRQRVRGGMQVLVSSLRLWAGYNLQ